MSLDSFSGKLNSLMQGRADIRYSFTEKWASRMHLTSTSMLASELAGRESSISLSSTLPSESCVAGTMLRRLRQIRIGAELLETVDDTGAQDCLSRSS